MSQRTRILLVIALAMLPLLAFVIFQLWRDQDRGIQRIQRIQRIERDREALARAAALAADAFVEGHLSTVRALALAPVIADRPPTADRTETLTRLLAANPDWQGLSVVDADGWNLSTGNGTAPHTVNIADRPYFQRVMATGEPVVSSAIISRLSGLPSVVLAAAIQFASGERGVLVAPLPTGRLAESLRTRIARADVSIVVVDAEGHIFVDPDPERAIALASLLGRPDAVAALRGESGSRVLRIDGTDTLSAYAPVPGLGWAAILTEPTAHAFASVRTTLRTSLIILALAVATVAGAGWYFGGRLSRAYDAMSDSRREANSARTEAERQSEQAQFLSTCSRELAESLDSTTTLQHAAALCVPTLGDWCAVDVVQGDRIERVAISHADPAKAGAAHELARRYPPLIDAPSGPGAAIASGQPSLLTHVSDAQLQAIARDERHLELLRSLGLRSALAVPLRARGRTIGALTLVLATRAEAYAPDEVRLVSEVASRAAVAADNARLYGDLQDALGTRDAFLASAAHDLRTPLTAIKGSVQLLQRQLARKPDDLPEHLADGLTTVDTTATRMAQMLDSLLDLALLHFGRALELDRRPTDLAALARRVAAEEAQASALHTICVSGDDSLIGEWDAARLHRVISNLLGNATKYSPAGGVVRVHVSGTHETAECPGARAVFSITDEELGIPRAEVGRVFERFRRGSNVVGRIAGTGLGLGGARQIVEQHGGTIFIDSDEGAGTTVTVALPLRAGRMGADRPDREKTEGAIVSVASPAAPAGGASA